MMKVFFYNLYAVAFHVCRLCPINPTKASFISMHNAGPNDSLGEVRAEFENRGKFQIINLSRKDFELITGQGFSTLLKSIVRIFQFFTVKAYHTATSKYIFLNNNFMPMAKLKISKDCIVTQLWHGDGAFKKFGLDVDCPENIRKYESAGYSKLTYAICSSAAVRDIYANAFALPVERVLPLGSARTDYYFRTHNKTELRRKLDEKYPQCEGKKLVLYAPTFRESKAGNDEILAHLNIPQFQKRLGEAYALLIRLHPQIRPQKTDFKGAIDLTDYPNVNELVLLADILITDYSSIIMDFAHLHKPMIFFAYDLAEYQTQRNVYFEYEDYVPGVIVKTDTELIDCIAKENFDTWKIIEFLEKNFDFRDGNAAKRIVDYVL